MGNDFDQREQNVHGDQYNIAGNLNLTRLDPVDLRNQRNHAVLRQAVRRFWIDGVLKGSLYNQVRIRLGLDDRSEAVDNRPWKLTLHQTGQPDCTIPDDKEIVDIFDEMGQQLLILGEPGSGKTTTLLTLADELLNRAEKDPTLPTPVVFNLSSWAADQSKLEDWLIDELNTRYQMPSKVAKGWVENDELLLLLDGLDEVADAKRNACANAINAFLKEHVMGIAVCSRTIEYKSFQERLKLVGAVSVRPLTIEQIEAYIEQAGLQTSALKTALAENEELGELAQTPLMLNIITLAYQKQNSMFSQYYHPERTIRQQLFDRYIRRMFQHRDMRYLYSSNQITHWLRWLAKQMDQHNQSIFRIEYIQPSWLHSKTYFNLYRLLITVVLGLTSGMFIALVIAMVRNPTISFSSGLLIGLRIAIGNSPAINIAKLKSWSELRYSWNNNLRRIIKSGTPLGLIAGATILLFAMLENNLTVGIKLGALVAVTVFFVVGLDEALQKETWLTRDEETRPSNKGIWNSLKAGLSFGLVFGIVLGFTGLLLFEMRFGLMLFLSTTWLVSLQFGLSTVIKHILLRWLLWLKGYIPWNYTYMLDNASNYMFLREIGGGYIFVHRLIMEHFASLTDEDIARIIANLDQD